MKKRPMSPSVGFFLGRPERSARLARGLRARGLEVVHYNTVAVDGEPVVPVRPGFRGALAHVLLRTRHDAYYTGHTHGPSLSLYLNRLLRGKPYVFNATAALWEMFHDRSRNRPFAPFFERRLHPFLLDRTFGGASRIVCNSRFLEGQIAQRYPQYRDRLLTVYNGVDFDRYAGGRRRNLPGISRDHFVLLCVTTLNYGRKSAGLALVLQAFEQIRAAEPRARLVVAAKTESPLYEEWAKEAVVLKSLEDSVQLHFNHPSVPDLLASADLFLYATPNNSNDSLPRALIEAQTAGLAAVTTDTSGCPEVVSDGKTGRVVPYRAEAMAEAVLTLMSNPRLRREMGQSARVLTPEAFSWDRMADEYASVFYEITSSGACRRPSVEPPRRTLRAQ